MKILLLTILLSGCQQLGYHTTSSTNVDGERTSQRALYTQETHQSAIIEDSRKQCYMAIVAIEQEKAKSNPALMMLISKPNVSDTSLMMVAMMIENNKLVGKLLPDDKPMDCGQLNQYEYKLALSNVRHKFWGNFAGNVIKYGTAAFLGDKLIDGLARDTITAGSNSVINNGGGNLDNSDRRDLSTQTSTVDSNDISSSNSEAGEGDLNDSPEVINELPVDEVEEVEVPDAEAPVDDIEEAIEEAVVE